MKFLIKLNTSILLAFFAATAIAAYFYHGLLEKHAHRQVSYQAELLLDQIDSIRTYTVEEIRPLTKQDNLIVNWVTRLLIFYDYYNII